MFSTVTSSADHSIFQHRTRVAEWLIVLILLTFGLVIWGGTVRLTGSGLSIPEWPFINGSLFPPLSEESWQKVYETYHTRVLKFETTTNPTKEEMRKFRQMFWIEYGHRAMAGFAGIIFLTLLIQSLHLRTLRNVIGGKMVFAAVVLVVQIILGGYVVKTEVLPEVLAMHMGTAFLFLSILIWTVLTLSTNVTKPIQYSPYNILSWFGLGFLFLQILSGALVAGTFAAQIYNSWPLIEGYLIPPYDALFQSSIGSVIQNLYRNPLTVQFIHRWLGLLTAAILLILVIVGYRHTLPPRAKIALRLLPTVLTIQVLLGLANLLFKAPFWLALGHQVTAVPLYALTLIVVFESRFLVSGSERSSND